MCNGYEKPCTSKFAERPSGWNEMGRQTQEKMEGCPRVEFTKLRSKRLGAVGAEYILIEMRATGNK